VHQVSGTSAPGYDPGPVFALNLANTSGLRGIRASFKLQSLDYGMPRISTWSVYYGLGAAPTQFFIGSTTGDTTTGNLAFKSSTINTNFLNAIDNQSGQVWIIIASLNSSTGSGNRATTGIDDFSLTWTTSPTGATNLTTSPETSLSVFGTATSDKIVFGANTEEAANYSFAIYDITGRVLHTETINATTGFQQFTVTGLHLTSGMYFAKMFNGNSSSVTKFSVQ
jgi:hypothetical protein